MTERRLSTHVKVDRYMVLVEWNGKHTVNAYIDSFGGTIRPAPQLTGVCSIGDYANDAATLDDFLRCVREFEQDPFNHPLWTG